MSYIWFFVGVIVVSVVYFLTGTNVDPWPALEAATAVAAVYMLALVIFATRKPFPLKSRIIALVVCVGFAIAAGSFSMTLGDASRWQKSQLLKILGVIHKGILNDQSSDLLLETLDKYHRQPAGKKSMGKALKDVVPAAAVGADIYKRDPQMDDDGLKIFVANMTDDEVVLVGQASWGHGRSPDFTNFNGKKGLVQERAILTAKGVTYESQN